jgi:hypothetical protein
MDAIRGLFGGGGQGAGASGSSPGLLADWNSYATAGDVEAGGSSGAAGAGPGSKLAAAAGEVGGNVASFFRSSYAAVSDGVGSISSTSLESTCVHHERA